MAALQAGDPSGALEKADLAVTADASLAEGYQVRGIALTRLHRLEEATPAFRNAADRAPEEAKHFYNLAVNLADRGMTDEAATLAQRAIVVDPRHVAAQVLLGKLTGTEVRAPSESKEAPTLRAGYGEQLHVLPFMYGMEKAWDGIGYGLVGFAAVVAVLFCVHLPMGPTGAPVAAGQLPDIALRPDTLSIVVVYGYLLSNLLNFMWLLVDVIDRRRKFAWFIPFVPCGVVGFSVLPLALYVFVGRRMEPDGVSK